MQVLQHVAADEALLVQHGADEASRVRPIEAARLLGVNRSTLSRYLKQHESLIGPDGLVDIDELKRHRKANLDVPAPTQRETHAPSQSTRTRHSDAKARLAEIEVAKRELELAKEAGELVDARDMGDKLIETASLLRDTLLSPDITLSERLAAETDPRLVRELVKEWSRGCLEAFVKKLEKLSQAPAA